VTAVRPSERRGALGVAALALLALAAVRAGGGGPPLYDGICQPPHYLALGASPGPGSASMTYSGDYLAHNTLVLFTSESTPQAQIIVAAGSFTLPPGSTATLTITAVAPPPSKPADGTLAGNVYRFAAQDQAGRPVNVIPGHPATIDLEAPSASGPQLTLERFDDPRWTPLKTFQSGCGSSYDAASQSLGLFALVAPGGSASNPSGGSGGGAPVVVIVVAVAIVVLALIVGATRQARRRR
jgi:hypothetical protein